MNPEELVKRIILRLFNHLGYRITKIKEKRDEIRVNYPWLVHLLYFKEVFDLIADVEGDVVECGVGRGDSFFKLCCLAFSENKGRKIYAFDSFEGFPEPSEE